MEQDQEVLHYSAISVPENVRVRWYPGGGGVVALCADRVLCSRTIAQSSFGVVRFPGGRGGTVTWQPSPRGWRGTVFPGAGQDKGEGCTRLDFHLFLLLLCPVVQR